MKYSTHDYAQALVAAIEEKKSATIGKNFLALVRQNHDEARLGKILDEAARLARRGRIGGKEEAGVREVVVESARPLGKSQEALIKNFLKPGDVVKHKITPDLVAGVKIVVNDEMQFDGSLKAKLDSLFSV